MSNMESEDRNNGYVDASPLKKKSRLDNSRNKITTDGIDNTISNLADEGLDKLEKGLDIVGKKIEDKANQFEGFVDALCDVTANNMNDKKNLSREEREIAERDKDDRQGWAAILMLFGIAALCFGVGGHILWYIAAILIFIIAAYIVTGPTIKSTMKQAKEHKYDGVINRRGNTSLYNIASYVSKSVEAVCADLQAMIKDGYFCDDKRGYDAYIDRDYMMLVITKDDIPIKDPAAEFEKKQEAEKYKDDSTFVKDIREAIDVVEDEEMTNYLYDLEGSVRRIEIQIKKKPELKHNTDIIKLNNYYLPEIVKLVKKYTEGQTPGMMATIKDALETCAIGLAGIEREISEIDEADMDIDIKVLKDTFKRDGLLGSDFDIK